MNETRVRLQTLSPGGDDYINASVIEAILPGAPNFIAAQGPKLENNGDFWKMVKQQRVRIIAMVTNCTEQGRSKCAQ
jgi:protein tyrosine phosphatase